MKKLFIAALLVLAAFIVQTAPAFAAGQTYTEEQIIRILRQEIDNGGKSGWASGGGGIGFNDAEYCYLAPSGIIYSVTSISRRNLSQAWFITQVDLSANRLLWIEGYYQANPMYGNLVKLNKDQYISTWQTDPTIDKYCNYLREHYNEIKGAN